MRTQHTGKKETYIREEIEYLCDECGKVLGKSCYDFGLNIPITLNTEWQDYGDKCGNKYLFCSTRCFRNYCRNNLNDYKNLSLSSDETDTVDIRLTIKELKERFIYNE